MTWPIRTFESHDPYATITRCGLFWYDIRVSDGLMETGWAAFTRTGARHYARRQIRRMKRQRSQVIEVIRGEDL